MDLYLQKSTFVFFLLRKIENITPFAEYPNITFYF